MDTDEREIFQFLKTWGLEFTSAMEVCRRAGSKKRFYEDPNWAKPVLARMEERGILQSDIQGRYRVKPVARKKKGQWVAPDIARILEAGGVETNEEAKDGAIAEDEYYDQL